MAGLRSACCPQSPAGGSLARHHHLATCGAANFLTLPHPQPQVCTHCVFTSELTQPQRRWRPPSPLTPLLGAPHWPCSPCTWGGRGPETGPWGTAGGQDGPSPREPSGQMEVKARLQGGGASSLPVLPLYPSRSRWPGTPRPPPALPRNPDPHHRPAQGCEPGRGSTSHPPGRRFLFAEPVPTRSRPLASHRSDSSPGGWGPWRVTARRVWHHSARPRVLGHGRWGGGSPGRAP